MTDRVTTPPKWKVRHTVADIPNEGEKRSALEYEELRRKFNEIMTSTADSAKVLSYSKETQKLTNLIGQANSYLEVAAGYHGYKSVTEFEKNEPDKVNKVYKMMTDATDKLEELKKVMKAGRKRNSTKKHRRTHRRKSHRRR